MKDNEKLDLILSKLERLEPLPSEVDKLSSKVDALDSKVDTLDSKVASLDSKVARLDSKVACLDSRVDTLDSKVASMDNDVKALKFTMDNEIRINIQRIAEGHLDLARNLQEAMKPNRELEMLTVKVRTLESDVHALKRVVNI